MESFSDLDVDKLVSLVHSQYTKCGYKPSNEYQFTILAAFVLVRASNVHIESGLESGSSGYDLKVISLATGSKCLPKSRLPPRGDALHDSHAEVLARRAAIRWLYEEIQRYCANVNSGSEWLIRREETGKYALRDGVSMCMYISTLPCGDASMRLLASTQLLTDPSMAALKSTTVFSPLPPNTASRGRDNYSLLGVLRTKPGRADSPPTVSMSCSDKIASWAVLGVQGALMTELMEPVHVKLLIIGEGDVPRDDDVREWVEEDCERAVWGRLEGFEVSSPVAARYKLTRPRIFFTSREFIHSRASTQSRSPDKVITSSSNESLCWYADSPDGAEVIINGARRGIGAARRGLEKYRPRLCKLSLFSLHAGTLRIVADSDIQSTRTYFEAKRGMEGYEVVRVALKGTGGPFAGWVVSGREWESFTLHGTIMSEQLDGQPQTATEEPS